MRELAYDAIKYLILIVLMIIACAIGASIGVLVLPDGYAKFVCIAFMGAVFGYKKPIFKFIDNIFKKKK
uniref:Uncharacterized protein n=1 Tax=uncultured prokaryote TaxID=198431 RepID=A0A0H5Q5C2_9ZZZZ|nr:hypothetical protein [uncultured prokaryote]